MSEQIVIITKANTESASKEVNRLVQWGLDAYGSVQVVISQVKRTKDQNKKMWALLRDISDQVEWYGKTYTPNQWKHILSGSFENYEFVPNTEGTGLVAVGKDTSDLSKKRFSEFVEFMYGFGGHVGVVWSEEAEQAREMYGDKEEVA